MHTVCSWVWKQTVFELAAPALSVWSLLPRQETAVWALCRSTLPLAGWPFPTFPWFKETDFWTFFFSFFFFLCWQQNANIEQLELVYHFCFSLYVLMEVQKLKIRNYLLNYASSPPPEKMCLKNIPSILRNSRTPLLPQVGIHSFASLLVFIVTA